MNIIEKQIVKSYHLQRMSQQAITPAEAQGWTSKLVQDARFNAIIGLADFNDASVLDIGCGYGDFKARLDQEFNQVKYIGIDQQQEFISRACLLRGGYQSLSIAYGRPGGCQRRFVLLQCEPRLL